MKSWFRQPSDWAHLSHLTTCLWMVAALIQTGEVNLTRWIPFIPCRGQYAQSKQRRIHRWLHNARINGNRLYQPIIQAALADWKDDCLYLSLDTSMFWDEYCLVRLVVVHRGRALPVVWRVLEHRSAALQQICVNLGSPLTTTIQQRRQITQNRAAQIYIVSTVAVGFTDYREMLQQAVNRLPKGVKVVLLADRGFVHTDLMKAMTTLRGLALSDSFEKGHLDLASRKRLVSAQRFPLQAG